MLSNRLSNLPNTGKSYRKHNNITSTELNSLCSGFYYGNGYWVFSESMPVTYHDQIVEISSNQFKWAFIPDAQESMNFAKNITEKSGIKIYGITAKGFKNLIAKLKSQPLFKTLSNVSMNSQKHYAIITGDIKDKKGKKHMVKIELESTGYRVGIDTKWR